MGKLFKVAALAALVNALIAPAAVNADPLADCRQGRNPELRIAACSILISGATFSVEQKAAAYRYRGSARADAGALDQALADLGEAIRLNPADAFSLLSRGQTRLARGDTDGAIADYTEALRLSPRSALAHTGRGHAHLVRGDAEKAIADFSEAISLAPQSATAFNNRGLAYRKRNDLARAAADYTAAISLNPIYALAYNNRAYVREAEGNKLDAIADFSRALLLDPTLVGAREGLARLGGGGTLVQESADWVRQGKLLVEAACARCHAVGAQGESPNAKAPQFRSLHTRHPIQALREPLTRAIAAPHDEMPKFAMPEADIDRIVAYINSLAR